MPWTPKDAKSHTKKADTPKKARQWNDIANGVLKRTGNDALAIREANGVIKRRGNRKAAQRHPRSHAEFEKL